MEIVYAEPDLGLIGNGLVLLTAALSKSGVEISEGLLGGEFGYGAIFENSVFMMNPFCWCDKDDCAWCANCTCPDSTWKYFADGNEVTWDEYMAFFEDNVGERVEGEEGWRVWEKKADEINARRSQVHTPTCHWCTHPELVQPNFLHKASGTRVTWYKYIGRSMEASLKGSWTDIIAECLSSVGSVSVGTTSPASLEE
jgi:hypothetical protein